MVSVLYCYSKLPRVIASNMGGDRTAALETLHRMTDKEGSLEGGLPDRGPLIIPGGATAVHKDGSLHT